MKNNVNDIYIAMYNRPRSKTEIDLVSKIYDFIKKNSGKKPARKFIQHPDIVSIKDLNPAAQRIVINKYFSTSLFTIRETHNKKIANLITFLVNEGTDKDWLRIMGDIFIPELKNKELDVLIFR